MVRASDLWSTGREFELNSTPGRALPGYSEDKLNTNLSGWWGKVECVHCEMTCLSEFFRLTFNFCRYSKAFLIIGIIYFIIIIIIFIVVVVAAAAAAVLVAFVVTIEYGISCWRKVKNLFIEDKQRRVTWGQMCVPSRNCTVHSRNKYERRAQTVYVPSNYVKNSFIFGIRSSEEK